MARTGRPPIPIEEKRRRGTLRPHRLQGRAVVWEVAPLGAGKADLSSLEAFEAAVRSAPWLTHVDVPLIALTRDALEDYTRVRDAGDLALAGLLRRHVSELLARLGLDPTARARLGAAIPERTTP